MKTGTFSGIAATLMLAGFVSGAFAAARENPYQVIIQRNPFALKPIPEPQPAIQPATVAETPPPLDIKLTGITTLVDPPRVFLEFIDPKTKKTERPPPMAVGADEFGVEIVAIDPEAGTVRVRQGLAETTLDFDKNGIKPAATATATPVPVPGAPGVIQPRPAVPPPVTTVSAAANTGGRGIVAGNNTPTPLSGVNPAAPNTVFSSSGGIPQRPVRVDQNPANNVIVAGAGQPFEQPRNTQPQQPSMTREEAEVIIEARRRELQAKEQATGQPTTLRIMPPTRWTQQDGAPNPNPNMRNP